MHVRRTSRWMVIGAVGLAVLAAWGCGSSSDSGEEPGGGGGGGNVDAGSDTGGSGGTGGSDGGVDSGNDSSTTPTGTSFDDAIEIAVDDTTLTSGVIDTAGKVEYYKFTGKAGDFIEIFTQANTNDDPTMIDPVVTLYDGAKKRLAENNDAFPFFSLDSDLYVHLPADGTYFVTVQDSAKWSGGTARGDASFTYDFGVATIDPATEGVAVDSEKGDDAASADDLAWRVTSTKAGQGWILGTFKAGADVDVFKFQPVSAGLDAGTAPPRIAFFSFTPSGDKGNGSTGALGDVWVTSADGNTVIAKVDGSRALANAYDFVQLTPPLDTSLSYLLWVQRPATGGSNDFYAAPSFTFDENPLEAEAAGASGTNDALADAEAAGLSADSGDPNTQRAFVAGNIAMASDGDGGVTSDVDYWKFDAPAGATIVVSCSAALGGSGLRGATVSVRDGSDADLGTKTEPADRLLLGTDQANPIKVNTAGTHYVRVTAASQDATVTSSFYRCGIRVTAP